jgi:hypothetical protein
MAEGDIGSVVDTLVFYSSTILNPRIIHITGNIYAIVYSDVDGDGVVCTVSIDSDGNVGGSVIDSLEFDTDIGLAPEIEHVHGEVYAIAFTGAGTLGVVVTISIDSDGAISNAILDTLTFDALKCLDVSFFHVSGSTYAAVYVGNANHGVVTTFSISDGGTISAAIIDTFEFEAVGCGNPKAAHVAGLVYVVAHAGSSYPGQLTTFTISAGGEIGASVIDTAAYNTSSGYFNRIIHISGTVFAVVYRGSAYDGYLSTVSISPAGDIETDAIEVWEFDVWEGRHPVIRHISGDVYIIAHDSGGSVDNLITIHISDAGDIDTSIIDSFDFPAPGGSYFDFLFVAGSIYAAVFRGSSNYGRLETIYVETILPSAPRHELLMGIG